MELFLNLLWAAIAAGTLLAYFWQQVAGRNRFRLGLGALLCALVFLMPAVSITDDLHSGLFAVEDANFGKRLMQKTVKIDLGSHVAWLPFSFRTPLTTWLPSIRIDIAASFYFLPDMLLSRYLLDRAPPCVCA